MSRPEEILAALTASPFYRDGLAVLAGLPDDPATLAGVAALAVDGADPRGGQYVDALVDRLPAEALDRLVERAVRRLGDGPSPAAGTLLAYASLRQPRGAPPPWHLAFPADVLAGWAERHPLRAHNSSWPVRSGTGVPAVVSGWAEGCCPRCRQPLHRLLRLDPVPPGVGITCRDRVEFAWCLWCGPYAEVGFARHDAEGAPFELTAAFVVDPPEPEPEPDLLPATEVELVRLDERWWRQDWALSNDRENLHRLGGEPTWIQGPRRPACPGCAEAMSCAGQVCVGDLWDGEGICYLLWCDRCAISGVVYQQT